MNIAIIRNVVAEVLHRARVNGRNPQRIDAEPLQIIEPLRDPREIADAIAVAVLKAARVHLVDHPTLPPEVMTGLAAVAVTCRHWHLPPPLRCPARQARPWHGPAAATPHAYRRPA